jgi:hypothetical protein
MPSINYLPLLQDTAEAWLDANPRQKGERKLAYVRRASREIRSRADRRDSAIPWAILLPFLLELIKLWLERRQS